MDGGCPRSRSALSDPPAMARCGVVRAALGQTARATPRVDGAVPRFCPLPPGGGVPPILLLVLLALKHDPRTLPQCDPGRRPARHRRPVGRHRHLKVVHAGDVLNDAAAGVVPDVHAEGEVRLGFHGQARLDSPWPGTIYTLCCYVACAPAQTARTLPLSSVTPCR